MRTSFEVPAEYLKRIEGIREAVYRRIYQQTENHGLALEKAQAQVGLEIARMQQMGDSYL